MLNYYFFLFVFEVIVKYGLVLVNRILILSQTDCEIKNITCY